MRFSQPKLCDGQLLTLCRCASGKQRVIQPHGRRALCYFLSLCAITLGPSVSDFPQSEMAPKDVPFCLLSISSLLLCAFLLCCFVCGHVREGTVRDIAADVNCNRLPFCPMLDEMLCHLSDRTEMMMLCFDILQLLQSLRFVLLFIFS